MAPQTGVAGRDGFNVDTTTWVIILVVVLVAAGIVAWLVSQQRKRKQHEHAEHLRAQAHEQASELPEAQRRAKEAEAQAETARLEAERAQERAREAQVSVTQQEAVREDHLRTADQVDPGVDTTSEDYSAGAGAREHDTGHDVDDARRTDETGGTRTT